MKRITLLALKLSKFFLYSKAHPFLPLGLGKS